MEFHTARLVLREFEPDDWRDVLAYQSDEAYLAYNPWESRSAKDARKFVQTFVGWQQEEPRRRFQFAITLQGAGVIGSCGVRRKQSNEHEADIGFEVSPKHWRNGYATEATSVMVDFGFRGLDVQRLSSWCIVDNQASAAVLRKLGFRQEGTLRRNEFFKGRYWDTSLFGLLREEWADRS